MGIISALVSALKAKARYEAKLDHIDAAIKRSRPDWWERMPIGGIEERRDADQAPTVPLSGTGRA